MTNEPPSNSPFGLSKRLGDSAWLALACLGLGAVLLVMNWGLVTGRAAPMWDADGQGVPYQALVADFATQGRLMGWDPWNSGGSPDFAEPQFGAMSPVAVGMGWLTGGTLLGYCLYWLFWWWVGGLGILFLGQSLGSPRWVCWSTAVGFMFSGLFLTDAEHIPFLIGFSSLGWIVWRVDAGARQRHWWPMVEAGALWGLSGLSGYPGIVLINACFAAVWLIGRVVTGGVGRSVQLPASPAPQAVGEVGRLVERWGAPLGPRWPSWAIGLIGVVALGFVGVCVLSPTYFGFIHEMPGYTTRSGALARSFAIGTNALHPGAVSALSSPYVPIMKAANQSALWEYSDVSGCGFYIGALSVVLAVFSLVVAPRDKWRWWLLAMGIGALALAMGQALPFRGWLYDVFPPARYFRHGVNFRCYFLFAIIVLALEGGRDLASRGKEGWRIFGWAATFVGIVALVVFGGLAHFVSSYWATPAAAWAQAIAAWGGVALLVWIGALGGVQHPGRIVVFLAIFATLDGASARWLSWPLVETRNPQMLWVWRKVDETRTDELELTKVGLTRVLTSAIPPPPNNKNLMIKEASLVGYSTLVNTYFQQWVDNPDMASMATGPDRIWFAPAATTIELTQENFVAFAARAKETGGFPAVIHSPDAMLDLKGNTSPDANASADPAIRQAPPAQRIGYELSAYEPDRLALKVRCPKAGWLLVTDRWARSWRAEVNGKATAVMGAGFVFRAVAVEAGDNLVSMEFVPMGRGWLVGLSWGLMGLVLVGTGLRALAGHGDGETGIR